MISVVICSINKILAEQVSKNILDTIGVPFELIVIDNNLLKKGIAHVYNLGAERAKYDVICFVHEDVLFQTKGWGEIITGYFNRDHRLGLIGVAGSKYKSGILSGWWQGLTAMDCCNILNFDDDNKPVRIFANPDPSVKLQQVITLDGVFLCATRQAWLSIPFNESLITGFHFYDIDFSFTVSQKFNVAATYEIDIVHLNRAGDFGNAWVNHAIDWHRHHQLSLPRGLNGKIKATESGDERKIYRNWLYRLRYENISLINRFRVIFFSGHWTHYRSWAYIGLFLFYKPYHTFISVFRSGGREKAHA